MTIEFKAHHVRAPEKVKSDDFRETSDRWLCTINGVEFDYYMGIGHRKTRGNPDRPLIGADYSFNELKNRMNDYGLKSFISQSKPTPPVLDDLLYALCSDAAAAEMSFEDWAGDLGYDVDSIKALETYRECQKIAGKLRKARINIEAERKRLENY